jgi:DNA-directed RNA polymerase sigma subunit (sigma70/sigma32)
MEARSMNHGRRVCCQCKTEKPVSEFYRRLDGYQSRCKVCDSSNRVTRLRASMLTGGASVFGGAVMTHEEIGAVLGVTRARVQQIEAQALKKLYRAAAKRGMRP